MEVRAATVVAGAQGLSSQKIVRNNTSSLVLRAYVRYEVSRLTVTVQVYQRDEAVLSGKWRDRCLISMISSDSSTVPQTLCSIHNIL